MLLLVALLAAAPDNDPRLARGEVIVTTEPTRPGEPHAAVARGVIDAPPEKVWALVQNCNGYKQTMPNILESEELERNGNVVKCRVVADLPFPFDDLRSVTRAVHTVEPGVKWQRQWSLVAGDYTVNEGRWLLQPYGDGKTLATYRIDARPKVALPEWMLQSIQQGKLPEIIQRLRKQTAQ